MYGRALAQIEAAYDSKLTGAIGQVAAGRGVVLTGAFTRYEWKSLEAAMFSFPALVVQPRGRATAKANVQQNIREGLFGFTVHWGIRTQSVEDVKRHLLHVPEALVMVTENLDELAADVLTVQDPIGLQWDRDPYEDEDEGAFEAWIRLDAVAELYTNAIALA